MRRGIGNVEALSRAAALIQRRRRHRHSIATTTTTPTLRPWSYYSTRFISSVGIVNDDNDATQPKFATHTDHNTNHAPSIHQHNNNTNHLRDGDVDDTDPDNNTTTLTNDDALVEGATATSLKSLTNTATDKMVPPTWAVTRALQNEPDDEWDYIVESTPAFPHFHPENNDEFVKEELFDDEDDDNRESSLYQHHNNNNNNNNFYDWQWKIIGTARLLEAAGSWTDEQWCSAEHILLHGLPEQHCIRAVILQFALLRRAARFEMTTMITPPPAAAAPLTSEPPLQLRFHPTSNDVGSRPYSDYDERTSVELFPLNHAAERKFEKKLLSRLVNNWRLVYLLYPDVLNQCHLSPCELLDDILRVYCGTYGISVTEKVFRHILIAEMNRPNSSTGGTPEFAEQILSHCLDLYDAGMEDCFPTTSLWNYVLLSWVQADRRTLTAKSFGVARIVRLMEELKVPRSRQTYRILFRECVQRGTEQSARDAEALLRQMYKEFLADNFRVQPDMSSFIYVADAWAKSKSQLSGPRAEQIYEQMKALRAKNHLLDDHDREGRLVTCVVTCFVAVGNEDAARKAEEFYRRTGASPDASLFSALISIYAKYNDLDGAERIWNELISNGNSNALKEIEFSASALLDAYATANVPNKLEKVEELFNSMIGNERINVDTSCYNAYMKVLMTEKNDDTKLKAHEILRHMREESPVKPNVVSYTTVMNGWAQMGNHEQTRAVLRLMYDDFVKGNVTAKPDIVAYNTLLTAYLRSGDQASWSRAAALVEHMKKISEAGALDIQPDVFSMSTALACLSLCTDKLVEAALKAEDILNEMRVSYQYGNARLQPNSYCYNCVMDVWARQGKPKKVEAIFLQMCNDVKDGNSAAKPVTATYNILLKSWAFSYDPEAIARTEQIIEEMSTSNVKPDIRSYTTLISCYGRSRLPGAPQKAEKVLRFMDELYDTGILKEGPSIRTFRAVRKAWKVSNEPDKATAIAAIDAEMNNRFGFGTRD